MGSTTSSPSLAASSYDDNHHNDHDHSHSHQHYDDHRYHDNEGQCHDHDHQHDVAHAATNFEHAVNITNGHSGTNRGTGKESSDFIDDHDAKQRQDVLRRLYTASILCTCFIIVEVTGGLISNSLAILSDASHLFADLASFVVASTLHFVF
jgi:zinc transporter 2